MIGGFKAGELAIITAGRRSGKSTLYEQILAERMKIKFEKVDEAIVDDEQWYTISTQQLDIAAWLRTQPKKVCVEQSTEWATYSYFDIHEKLYTMMELKFQ